MPLGKLSDMLDAQNAQKLFPKSSAPDPWPIAFALCDDEGGFKRE